MNLFKIHENLTKIVLLRGIRTFNTMYESYYFGEFALLVLFMNRTTSGIVLSEFVLSGDPLYMVWLLRPGGIYGDGWDSS